MLIIGCDSKYGFIRWLLNETESESLLDAAIEAYQDGEYEASEGVFVRLYTVSEMKKLIQNAGCELVEIVSTPVLMDTWDHSGYPKEQQEALMGLELNVCTEPELLGMGHHLICIARKL